MAKPTTDGESHATERVIAPATATPVYQAPLNPRQMQLERQGEATSPLTIHFPEVRGGICEYCGVLDPNYPSEYQYKLCPHYRGMQLRCRYCPSSKNPDEVINHTTLHITAHPDNLSTLVVCCDSYECLRKHTERFKLNA